MNTVTSTGKVPAVPVEAGTVQRINVLFAALISHSAPPMVTKLVVASGENLVPVMVSCVPEGAAAGNTDDMVGVCSSE